MHLTETNGYWYVRRSTADGKETVAKLGQHDDRPAIYRPRLVQDKAENVLARLPDDSVNCLITDPPYGIDFENNMPNDVIGEQHSGDLMGDDEAAPIERIAPEISRVLAPDGHCYVFTSWKIHGAFRDPLTDVLDLNTVLVWDKKMNGLGNLETWGPRHEWILHLCNGDPGLNGGRPPNVLRYGGGSTGAIQQSVQIHPTQKPRRLIEFIIKKSTDPGDVVFDPFGGAYTTARAAMRTFRRAVSCELDPETHRAAADLTEKQLRDDPEHGTDWTDVTNLRVEDVDLLQPLARA